MRYWPMLLVCPLLSGCFGYCYPSFTHTPAIVVNEADARAFRVKEDRTFFGFISLAQGTCAMEEIGCRDKEIPSASYSNFNYFAFAMPVIPIGAWNSHTVSVRLYRRGYETITIDDRHWLTSFWKNRIEELHWKKADTLEGREKAITDLYRHSLFWGTNNLKGAFIADEYVALANSELASGPVHEKTRKRLIDTAESFRRGEFYPGSSFTVESNAPEPIRALASPSEKPGD